MNLPEALHLGPLTLSTTVVMWLVVLGFASWLGARIAKTHNVAFDGWFYGVLLFAIVVGRAVFVWQYWAEYAGVLGKIIDVRDGGIHLGAALTAAGLAALVLLVCKQSLRKAVLASLLTVYVGAACIHQFGPNAAHQGLRLPNMALQTLAGETRTLQDLRGKPVVVNLWATWCPPCRREMPALMQFAEKNPQVVVVLVNQGEDAVTVAAYLQQETLPSHAVWLDPRSDMGVFVGQQALPTTLFFDALGRLQEVRMGELSEATLQQKVHALQAAQP